MKKLNFKNPVIELSYEEWNSDAQCRRVSYKSNSPNFIKVLKDIHKFEEEENELPKNIKMKEVFPKNFYYAGGFGGPENLKIKFFGIEDKFLKMFFEKLW